MKKFSWLERKENLEFMQKDFFDLIIIGGGINGAGIARDAAMRGLKVALVEANDFASGTSSKSSKLIHGGIRYLENLEFKLVFEALSERRVLFEIAPNMVHPLRFLLPIYKSSRYRMWQMGIGMMLYDTLSLFEAPELHEKLSVSDIEDEFPSLNTNNLEGAYAYDDAYMDDDRLVFATLRSAHDFGARIANYCKVIEINSRGSRKSIKVKTSDKEFDIFGRSIISCAGPWTDEMSQDLIPGWKKVLRPTKGVHITLSRERFPLKHAVVMGAEQRIVFAIPRHDMVIIGTTDTDFKEKIDNLSVSGNDINYLIEVTNEYFPAQKITEKDIIGSYVGLRPLVQDSASSEGKTSREHSIWTDKGMTFVAGGKYTTYRLIAEDAVEHILNFFPMDERIKFKDCYTRLPLNPLVTQESQALTKESLYQLVQDFPKLRLSELGQLLDRHGYEVVLNKNRLSQLNYLEIELQLAIENTMCTNITDFFARRVPVSLNVKDHGLSMIPAISNKFSDLFNLEPKQITDQIDSYRAYLKKEYSWQNP